jgi:hypothetical protein
MSLLDEIAKQVETMSEEELRAEFVKAQEDKLKRKAKQAEYNANPEAKAKRLDYQKTRNEAIKADPEKYAALTAKRKEYMGRPEVKGKMKEYRDKRNLLQKLVMQRAKELGIDTAALAAEAEAKQKSA